MGIHGPGSQKLTKICSNFGLRVGMSDSASFRIKVWDANAIDHRQAVQKLSWDEANETRTACSSLQRLYESLCF